MSVSKSIKRLVRDDSGNAAINDVAIMAVGAIVLIAVLGIWNSDILPNIKQKITEILSGGKKGG